MKLNSYELSRNWFDWSFDNPEKVNPNHSAIYFFAIEHCNRLGWCSKFGFPTQMAMDAIGIKKHQTYIKYFNDLCEWGFFKLIQKSQNQYSSNIISLVSALPKNSKALDKAIINHRAKQTETIGQSNSPIIKQDNHITINQITDFKNWFSDLKNSNTLIDIARINNLEVELVKKQLVNFETYAELSYPNYNRFVNHFKNWINKQKENFSLEDICPYTHEQMTYFRKLKNSDLGLPVAFDKRFTNLLDKY